MDQAIEQRIRERAYAIWEEEGRPDGRDFVHWMRAVFEVADETRKKDGVIQEIEEPTVADQTEEASDEPAEEPATVLR